MITVISVAYNSAQVISKALSSVLQHPLVKHVIIVDNASMDGTGEMVRAQFPTVEVISSPTNVGYGSGCNLGLERVATPYALLLNPDAAMQEGAIDALKETLDDTLDAAIAAPLLRFENGEIYTSYKRDVFTRERFGGGQDIVPEGPICASYLSGAIWLIRMEHWKTIGGFDPGIFLFYEDDDACLRLQKNGFSLLLVPQAQAIHLLGKSTTPSAASGHIKQFHLTHSRLYMERKYHGKTRACILALRQGVVEFIKLIPSLFSGNTIRRMRRISRLRGIRRFLLRMYD